MAAIAARVAALQVAGPDMLSDVSMATTVVGTLRASAPRIT